MSHGTNNSQSRSGLAIATLSALGIVYGDIGTSPLYALRECFRGAQCVPLTEQNVFGLLSLIFWSLVLVITVKYLTFVMRADNHGEGGILALMVLAIGGQADGRRRTALVLLGLFGAGLLYGDGVITPAISVLSAVEGLHIATPAFDHFVVPLTMGILFGLFLVQHRGTAHVGRMFGPVMLVWFGAISLLGAAAIVRHASVLAAFSPHFALQFFTANGWHGFVVVGVVFLVVTGGEALYADMGHFGVRPIRFAWFLLVLPALLINYFGQGALLIERPETLQNPFYLLAPIWLQLPLVLLATAATIIASQAVISGAFSLTSQAVHLGYCPRLAIIHTSKDERGQVYIPAVNWALFMAVIGLVLAFRTSERLASAYGMAITTTMVITAVLLYLVARRKWKWSVWSAAGLVGLFLVIDLAFFSANLVKILEGGWFPILIGVGSCLLMMTWQQGQRLVKQQLAKRLVSYDELHAEIAANNPSRIDIPAVYLTPDHGRVPLALMYNLRRNRVLHRPVAILTIATSDTPYVPLDNRLRVEPMGDGLFCVTATYGFKQRPHVPNIIDQCRQFDLDLSDPQVTFFIGRTTLLIPGRRLFTRWRKQVFAWMMRNANDSTAYFGIPAEQVVEIGRRLEI